MESSEGVEEYVRRLSHLKAEVVAQRHPGTFVIGADTMLCHDGQLIGKPGDREHAVSMLEQLNGRTHEVTSGFTVIAPGGDVETGVDTATVSMRKITASEISEYVDRVRPFAFAGAYAIQGEGANLVERVDGSVDTVIGMPMGQVSSALVKLGYGET
jgi:septum formation protein